MVVRILLVCQLLRTRIITRTWKPRALTSFPGSVDANTNHPIRRRLLQEPCGESVFSYTWPIDMAAFLPSYRVRGH